MRASKVLRDLVQVRFPGERIWVKPITINGEVLTARLVNKPFIFRDIKLNDVIKAVRNEEVWEFEKQIPLVERVVSQ